MSDCAFSSYTLLLNLISCSLRCRLGLTTSRLVNFGSLPSIVSPLSGLFHAPLVAKTARNGR